LIPAKEDFKDSARGSSRPRDALVLRGTTEVSAVAAPAWTRLPAHVLQEKPSVTQREGEKLPEPLQVLVRRMLEGPATIRFDNAALPNHAS